ncbi:MAG: SH3 domain-containing protein [Leptolyngbyaceae cyanobacterium CSU_1_4]|nr:SH3 domain-containing protein [Leptolyngbyaceae cyanobacterium CSU_1_4]
MKFQYPLASITALLMTLAAAPSLADTATIQASLGSRVNVRAEPSTTSLILHHGLGGDRVNVLNQTNAPDGFVWYFIEFPTSRARGWIRGDLLKVSATVPINPPAPVNPPAPIVNPPTSERVSFARRTSAATVGGTVQGTQTRDYVLNAALGQTLRISTIGTSQFLQVQVFAPDGTLLYTGSRDWSGILPSTGDYRIRVRLVPEAQQPNTIGEYSLTIAVL